MRVNVITAAKNHRGLFRTMQSVMEQVYSPFRYVVGDLGSDPAVAEALAPDGRPVVHHLREDYPHVQLDVVTNVKELDAAGDECDYCLVLSPGDTMPPDALQAMVVALDCKPEATAAIGSVAVIRGGKESIVPQLLPSFEPALKLLQMGYEASLSGMLFRTAPLRDVNEPTERQTILRLAEAGNFVRINGVTVIRTVEGGR